MQPGAEGDKGKKKESPSAESGEKASEDDVVDAEVVEDPSLAIPNPFDFFTAALKGDHPEVFDNVEVKPSFFAAGEGLFCTKDADAPETLLIEDPAAYVCLVFGANNAVQSFLSRSADVSAFFRDDLASSKDRRGLSATLQIILSILDAIDPAVDDLGTWCLRLADAPIDERVIYERPMKLALKLCREIHPGKFAEEDLKKLFRVVHTNMLLGKSLLLRDMPYGAGVWPLASKINHSCRPNCTVLVAYGRLHLISVRKIARGEELTIDYSPMSSGDMHGIDVYVDTAAGIGKRAKLNEVRAFMCACPHHKDADSEDLDFVSRWCTNAKNLLGISGKKLETFHTDCFQLDEAFLEDAAAHDPSVNFGGVTSEAEAKIFAHRRRLGLILRKMKGIYAESIYPNFCLIYELYPAVQVLTVFLAEVLVRGKLVERIHPPLPREKQKKKAGSERPVCWGCEEEIEKKSVPQCAGCHVATYCGKECQRKNWTEEHQDRCVKTSAFLESDFEWVRTLAGHALERINMTPILSTVGQVEMAMVCSATYVVAHSHTSSKEDFQPERVQDFLSGFAGNLAKNFWVPFVFPFLFNPDAVTGLEAILAFTAKQMNDGDQKQLLSDESARALLKKLKENDAAEKKSE